MNLCVRMHSRGVLALGVILSAFLITLIGFISYSSTSIDDVYLTFWPAYTLTQTGLIQSYDGIALEQSSSLAHTVAIAFLAKLLNQDVVLTGYLFSILTCFITIALTSFLIRRFRPDLPISIVILGTCLAGSMPFFVYWAFSGMETVLAAGCAILLILTLGSYLTDPSINRLLATLPAVALFVFVRPENFALLGCILLGMTIYVHIYRPLFKQRSLKRGPIWVLFLTTTIGVIFCFAFRLQYTGNLLPQSATVKSRIDPLGGIEYSIEQLLRIRSLPPVAIAIAAGSLAALVAIIYMLRSRDRVQWYILISALYLFASIAYVILVGGDWMPAARFFVPIFPLLLSFIPVTIFHHAISRRLAVIFLTILILNNLIGIYLYSRNLTAPDGEVLSRASRGMPLHDALFYYHNFGSPGITRFNWFERTNYDVLRDVITYPYLEGIIRHLHSRLEREIVVWSGQGGLIFYYLSRDYPNETELIETHSLTHTRFSDCPVLQSHIELSNVGTVGFSYENYFDINVSGQGLMTLCNIPAPDVIFDARLNLQTLPAGYKVIYIQDHSEQFIAVRNQLVDQLQDVNLVDGENINLSELYYNRYVTLLPTTWESSTQKQLVDLSDYGIYFDP